MARCKRLRRLTGSRVGLVCEVLAWPWSAPLANREVEVARSLPPRMIAAVTVPADGTPGQAAPGGRRCRQRCDGGAAEGGNDVAHEQAGGGSGVPASTPTTSRPGLLATERRALSAAASLTLLPMPR